VLHVCVSVPQLPHESVRVSPGAHDPVQAPPTQVWSTQSTGLPHWPHASHVCTPLPLALHCRAPGVHAGASGHEQEPHPQLALQVCEPYVLHVCVTSGAQAPWPAHVPSCQVPVALHVCVSVPQLPHASCFVDPGLHDPVHMPAVQTYGHGAPSSHWPIAPHVSGVVPAAPAHAIAPGVQTAPASLAAPASTTTAASPLVASLLPAPSAAAPPSPASGVAVGNGTTIVRASPESVSASSVAVAASSAPGPVLKGSPTPQ
jgi:hypothetical protein